MTGLCEGGDNEPADSLKAIYIRSRCISLRPVCRTDIPHPTECRLSHEASTLKNIKISYDSRFETRRFLFRVAIAPGLENINPKTVGVLFIDISQHSLRAY
ncbi:hypothetical protein ANN_08663 [Periplaneta americana]|uniref:Uncharacterized protein n=1 Tax=Periplaneta americana TaxID=6978 RepID=A0ABQ8T3Q0_PERAM|nr:hypothetical protein ANN_08663 [Periplaneta americana]